MITRASVATTFRSHITADAVVSMCRQRPQTATMLCRGLAKPWRIVRKHWEEARDAGRIVRVDEGWVTP